MTLPILTATDFRGIVPKGGSTKPWVVEAMHHSGIMDLYVVKMFTPRQVQQQNSVAKEVYGNDLARAFDLPVPDMALIRFGKTFLETLPAAFREIEEKSQQGLRFASRFASGYVIFDDTLPAINLDLQSMANVYAFDNLIWNLDRGGFRKKPNLLVRDNSFLLIDHEQIFPFADDPDHYNDTPIRSFQQGQWLYSYDKHLFFPYLRNLAYDQKVKIFSTFVERLNGLSLSIIEDQAQWLSENAQPVGNTELITDYLTALQNAPDTFTALLQKQLL